MCTHEHIRAHTHRSICAHIGIHSHIHAHTGLDSCKGGFEMKKDVFGTELGWRLGLQCEVYGGWGNKEDHSSVRTTCLSLRVITQWGHAAWLTGQLVNSSLHLCSPSLITQLCVITLMGLNLGFEGENNNNPLRETFGFESVLEWKPAGDGVQCCYCDCFVTHGASTT